jgi:flagellar motor component MotA
METLIVHPENKAQLNAVKKVLKAMKISFEKENKPYNPEFVAKIKKSAQNFKEGKFTKIAIDDLWK